MIRFDLNIGLAVGFVIAYLVLTHSIKGPIDTAQWKGLLWF